MTDYFESMKAFLFLHLGFFLLTLTACDSSGHEWIDPRGKPYYALIQEEMYPLTEGCEQDSDCQVDTIKPLESCSRSVLGSYLISKSAEWNAFKEDIERARAVLSKGEFCPALSLPEEYWVLNQSPVAICHYGQCKAKTTLSTGGYIDFSVSSDFNKSLEIRRSLFTVRNGEESLEGEFSEEELDQIHQAISEINRCETHRFDRLVGRFIGYHAMELYNYRLNRANGGLCDSTDSDAVASSVKLLKQIISSKIKDPSPEILESLESFEDWQVQYLYRAP